MQDKFVADEGDFGKYGLLRTLAGIEPQDEPRRLGVIWYFGDHPKLHDADLDYLSKPDKFRHFDEGLFDTLLEMANGYKRTVGEVRRREILGRDKEDVVFFSEAVPNRRTRRQWLSRALKKTEGTQIVFLDPDKGLPTSEREAKPERSKLYAYRNELSRFVEENKTVVVYQSYWRDGTRGEEVHKWRNERLADLDLDELPRVVGTADRAFIVLPSTDHAADIDRRLSGFMGRWGDHFKHQALQPSSGHGPQGSDR